MKDHIIYIENRASIGIFVLLFLFTIAMSAYFVIQLIYGPIGSDPAPNWFLVLFIVFFLLTTINFSHIRIKLTDEYIKVNYGLFGTRLNWLDIVDCEADEENHFYGWGIRFGKYKKEWLWVYNVIGGPRIVFLTGKKKPKGLIVSTNNPQEFLTIAKRMIGHQ